MSKPMDVSLAQARMAAGLTQKELAMRLGVGRPTLSSVENGHVRPWPRLRAEASRILGVDEQEPFESSGESDVP